MKRLLISVCTFSFILFCNSIVAQEKVKEKEDKTKMKDKASDTKVKDKDEKFKAKDDENKIKVKADDANQPMGAMTMSDLPYTANYSSSFTIGDANNSKMILELWKDWDDNMLDRHDYFADTIVMITSSGEMLQGKSAVSEAGKKFRGGMTSAKSTLDAWIPLKSVDRNENWVAIWGQEDDVYADGKKEKREIHEIWRINKDGKVDFMKQWTATPVPQQ